MSRPSRARRDASKDLSAGLPLTVALVESFTKRTPEAFWVSFWARVEIPTDADSCWLWKGSTNPRGYGQLALGQSGGPRKRLLAHRVAFVAYNQPEGLAHGDDLLHTCDNPGCVNPSHLVRGDQQANLADMRAKGRAVLPPNARAAAANPLP